MKLIFGGLAIFVAAMVLLAGAGVFGLTSTAIDDAKQQSVSALAASLAYSVSSQMQLFEKIIAQIATDQDVIAAIETGDSVLIENTAHKVEKFLPMALKVRLLPASVNAIDERQVPFMGYADLAMVKQTLIAKQPAIIQGEGSNRHLAVTASIKKGDQVIGVLLASLKFDFLSEILAKAPIDENFMQISQNSVVLGLAGSSSLQSGNLQSLKIDNSPWNISYISATGPEVSDIGLILGLVLVFALLSGAGTFLAYYYMAGLLKKDQNTVLEAVKNLMMGKKESDYEVKLTEMKVIISTLEQFKRILDNKNKTSTTLDASGSGNNNEVISSKKSASSLFKKKT